MEALPFGREVHFIHGSQITLVYVHAEGLEHETKEVVGVYEELPV